MGAERIPIAAAKRIADEFGQRQVILVCWDGETTHVVTYGASVAECEQAATGGNFVKRALGWPERLCSAVPARARRAKAVARVSNERPKAEDPKGLSPQGASAAPQGRRPS